MFFTAAEKSGYYYLRILCVFVSFRSVCACVPRGGASRVARNKTGEKVRLVSARSFLWVTDGVGSGAERKTETRGSCGGGGSGCV